MKFAGALATAALLTCSTAWAHGFGQRFTLPLPFWLYATGACLALLLSFAGLSLIKPARALTRSDQRASNHHATTMGLPARAWCLLNATLLGLSISAALFGSQTATANLAMTWFWILVVLVFFYAACGVGPHFRLLNPWWCAAQLLPSREINSSNQREFPAWLAGWPAFVMFMLLIGVELFGHASPRVLGYFLLGQSALCLLGCAVWGRDRWFAQGDLLQAMFRNMALLGQSLQQMRHGNAHTDLLSGRIPPGEQALIVAMLAATAFDALRESVPWASALWTTLLTVFPQPTQNPLAVLAALSGHYRSAEMLAWTVMPAVYGLVMALTVLAGRRLAPTGLVLHHDMGLAALALLPLVLGYHLAHYFTLVFSELPNLLHLLSDPFGWGWNLLGTANRFRAPLMLDLETVWHLQVAFIVAGHMGAVLVSHLQAARLHPSRAALVRSQLPNLLWMLGLTTWGLWTLSQPLKAG